MDEQKLNELAAFLLETFQEGKDFVSEQAPLVVQELIRWKTAEHSAWVAIAALLLLGAWLVGRRAVNAAYAFEEPSDGPPREIVIIAAWFLRCMAFLVSSILLLCQGFCLLQITLAPRVYLLEWVASRFGAGGPG